MNTALENIVEELQLDKSKWKLTKFGDVVIQQKGKVDRDNTKLTRYIQGGHMNSEDLHIRNWGNLKDEYLGPAFIRKFEKGDILYGSRRTYLRKVAIADFDGITSNTTFVIKANEKNIDKRLLPFIMMSEGFTGNSIKNSKGSVNPYINWKDIAKYEFLLPPKDHQAKLAELLWAIDDVIEMENKVLEKLKKDDLAYLKHYFYDDKTSERIKLKHIVSIKKGRKPPVLLEEGEGLPYCTAKYLRTGEIDSIVPKEAWDKSIKIDETDILVLWDGSNAGEMLFGKEGFLASTMCKLTIIQEKFLKDFVFQFLRFKTNDIKRATVGSAIPHVDPGMIENIEIPKLSLENQEAIIDRFKSIKNNMDLIESKIQSSKALQKSLINQVF
ncbi:restriction endonuclease subunit S [Polaribacter sargassicola]|uniref:restriction endonuclease subunit S n=1 Tax=Polaribacter sargassicola TaxID=2836891 RepID=UPI001F025C25|nr:restriction endonuclease subunit S [Polaribacter sp. DS7-9]MCG1035517.1 restriction endonuclease subunit S [Polaribacter sp. DS7-9]